MFEQKIKEIQKRYGELERLLQNPEVISEPEKLSKISKEYNELGTVMEKYKKIQKVQESLADTKKVLKEETDPELKSLAEEELANLKKQKVELERTILEITEPQNPLDKKDIIVEIRSGVGGDEAELFAADLFRMYSRFAERKGWTTHLISANRTPLGGFKEVIFEINGQNVYSRLKYESGVHRVQRIPKTEKSGRIHTSTATVAILPEAEEIDLKIDPKDLEIETSTSSGHGGQSVNTTYSAVRIKHLPTGLLVQCQDERSQKQNKEKAMRVLRSRLLAMEQEKQAKKIKDKRKKQIGGAMRAEKIRTYNFPQDRITDHRIKGNIHNINNVLDGNLDPLINRLKEMEKDKNV